MNFPQNVKYTNEHEWIRLEGDTAYVGITDYAQEQLGDIVFVELPEVDSEFAKGEVFATIESVKAASEIYMPVSGKVVEINEELINAPELINENVWEKGWLIKVKSDTLSEDTLGLMEYEDYREEVA